MYSRSDFGPWLSFDNIVVLYYVTFALLLAVLYVFNRLINAEFGLILRGCKSNERRVKALGFRRFDISFRPTSFRQWFAVSLACCSRT